ncbi:MAG: glycosyltransferase [Nitrospirae bacterium]|nr:glycosyltransferase [Nitrospirota bacterium]
MIRDNIALTFIIPHRETDTIEETVVSVKTSCEKAGIACEIFAVSGNNPTKQRNKCIDMARNDYIYFIDNDSIVVRESLEKFKGLIKKYPKVSVIGGPAIIHPQDNYLQKNFNSVLSSPLAVGKISSRYSKRGGVRETDDSELILCNLIVKKSIFDKVGKLNENLYPNEENEFIHRVKSFGEKVLYDPEIYVFKSQRETFKDFINQIFNYGRGRGEQTRISPKSFKPLILIPVFFSLYLPLYLILGISGKIDIFIVSAPLFLYLFTATLSWFSQCLMDKYFYLYYPAIFLLTDALYGFGFLYGFFKRTFKTANIEFSYKIEKIE